MQQCHATCTYSGTRPPRRSLRSGRSVAAEGEERSPQARADRAIGAGDGCCNARRIHAGPGRGGWSGDQDMVEAFAEQVPIQRSAMAFTLRARTRVRMMRRPTRVNTASKVTVNLEICGRGSPAVEHADHPDYSPVAPWSSVLTGRSSNWSAPLGPPGAGRRWRSGSLRTPPSRARGPRRARPRRRGEGRRACPATRSSGRLLPCPRRYPVRAPRDPASGRARPPR